MNLTQDMERYLSEGQEELKQLIRELCAIPAPSNHEEKRAAFCKAWFEQNGGENVTIDGALNVICPYRVTEDNEVVVFMAHTDTVFPDTEPMPMTERDGKLFCPGVTDDTAHLAILMFCARYVLQNKLPTDCGILFVANSGEEGLGDLKGSRSIVRQYGSRMREFVSLDGANFSSITTKAVGSHRYRVTVRTEGGHSFGKFGNRNAIRCLASMIETLYSVKVPEEDGSRTTYNVGTISGGTSVNTIAQEAEMLYEYRSDNRNCLAKMQHMFESVVEAYRATGIEVEVQKFGDRPCNGEIDAERWQRLIDRIVSATKETVGLDSVFRSGSTDSNIPLSVGIPAATIGVCIGDGCHTRGEWLALDSLLPGCRKYMELLAGYVQAG